MIVGLLLLLVVLGYFWLRIDSLGERLGKLERVTQDREREELHARRNASALTAARVGTQTESPQLAQATTSVSDEALEAEALSHPVENAPARHSPAPAACPAMSRLADWSESPSAA